ncbi:MAG TPA: redoxin domain-containing protein, partial [Bacteroidetes bacterium]|nr:redoxin domain-containing protein [Bacteroidota bacterium]
MKLIPGDKAKRIQLTDIDKQSFDSDSLIGKPYLLSFFRFANCPFCNLRMMNLVNA